MWFLFKMLMRYRSARTGSLYVISTFYKRNELAARNSVFFLGSGLASATTGLLAYGLLPLGKRYPTLHGWQWMMIGKSRRYSDHDGDEGTGLRSVGNAILAVEGCMAIFVSLLFASILPASPTNPSSLLFPKISLFSARERQILVARVYNDDSAKKDSGKKLGVKKDILGTLGNWRVWPHVLMAICLIGPTGAMGTYTPTLIKGFKFESK
jgi:hypothetical protein